MDTITRELYDLDEIPQHSEDCKDCQHLEELIEIVKESGKFLKNSI